MEHELDNLYRQRLMGLTGSDWCPYPSERFMRVIVAADDAIAIRLIQARRGFSFPHFLGGDPQEAELSRILRDAGP